MEYDYFYLFFPNGDKQPIAHQLNMGDIVDVNGNIYLNDLKPNQLAYKVVAIKRISQFKETCHFYKLSPLNIEEVEDEINYQETIKKRNLITGFIKKMFNISK